MRPEIISINNEHFSSALTVKCEKSENKQIKRDEPAVGEIFLTTLTSNTCAALQLLHIDECPKLTPQGIMSLVNHCRSLRDVSLSFSLLSDELLTAMSDEHVQLETLRIEAHSETKSLPSVSDEAWSLFSNHSPNINLVLLSYLTEENDHKLILKPCVPVTHLFLGECTPTSIVDKIADLCPSLKEIVIAAYGPETIDKPLIVIGNGCTRLSAIGLGDCEITCSGFVEFVSLCCERLKTLYVWETSFQEDLKFDIETASAKVSLLLGRTWNPESVPFC